MIILTVINFLAAGFIGYLLGRWGDNYLNFWLKDPGWAPHHWIYGFILIMASLFFLEHSGLLIFFFGLGLFISDLKDFLELKFIGKDNKIKSQRKFWNID